MTKTIKKFRRWLKKYSNKKIDKTSRELVKKFKISHGSVIRILKDLKVEPKSFTIRRFCRKGHDTFKTGRYPTGTCKVCGRELQKKLRERNKESWIAYSKKWQKDNAERVRDQYLKRRFGISLKVYDFLFTRQKGCCAICGIKQSKFPKRAFAVDHNHKTKKIRGLLCDPCNRGLGYFKDNPKLLYKALGYLL